MQVTDGGIETDLIFRRGVELAEFAAFPLLDSHGGRALLADYFADYATIARAAGADLLLETPTWRANPDWGALLGYDATALARVNAGSIDFLPGPGARTLDLPGFPAAGIQICYEIIFPAMVVDEGHRPAWIVNISNDAWFGSWGPPQHLAQARLRAIEEGLPIARATPI